MIKNFETYINEDYFSKLANRKDTGTVRKENDITEDLVKSYMGAQSIAYCHEIVIRKENGVTIVDIDGDFEFNASCLDMKEIPFQFGKVTGNFDCSYADITSLKGCPKEVGGIFTCMYCKRLKSLEGCPEKVGAHFVCHHCGKEFTKQEVRSLCDVEGGIYG